MRIVILFWLLIFSVNIVSQTKVKINSGVDTTDPKIKSIVDTWIAYLNSNPDSVYENPYWLSSEVEKYNFFDLINRSWFSPSLYYLMKFFKPSILSVSDKGDHYVIRTQWANTPKADSGLIQTLAITNVAAISINDQIKLCNILPFNTKDWEKKLIDSIKFIFPKTHNFNEELANKMNNFLDSLLTLWKIPRRPIEYYFAEDFDIVAKALGLDYRMGEGNKIQPRGFTDVANGIIYSGGSNEWYPHEFVHMYINPLFPNSNSFFLEGYATLMGGSGGKSFKVLIKEVNDYLKEHPEMDALNYTGLDYFVGPDYTIGALLCKMALDKGGMKTLNKLMSYEEGEDNLYNSIKDIFNVEKKNINVFIRQKLNEYSTK